MAYNDGMNAAVLSPDRRSSSPADALVREHLHLVSVTASRLLRNVTREEREDIEAVGRAALVRAAAGYDPAKGKRFQNYAVWLLRRVMSAAARQQNDTRGGFGGYSSERMQEPLPVSFSLSLPVKESADATSSTTTWGDALPDTSPDGDTEGSVLRECTAVLLWEAVQTLPPQQQQVLRLRYLEGRLFREIGAEMGVSAQRVQAIHDSALTTLRRQKGLTAAL